MLAQLVRRAGADDLVDGVLDDGGGEPCGNILDARALLLRLLDRAVHEHRAPRAQLDGVLCKQPQAGELLDFHIHRLGERLNKGAAARGARLVEHDRVDGAVFDLEALDVLSADVDDEVDVRVKVERCLEVRHRLHDAEVDLERRAHHLLAVARDARAADDDPVADEMIDLAQLVRDDVQRLSVVGLIMRIEDLAVGRDEHELGRRRARIDAKVRVPFVGEDVLKGEIAADMPRNKLVILLLRSKKRLADRDILPFRDRLKARPDLSKRLRLLLGGIQRRADGHKTGRSLGKDRMLLVQPQRAAECKAQPL